MVNQVKIRPSKEFREIIDYVRAKCLLQDGKCPSITEITKVISKKIDKEKLWEDEFAE